MQILQRAKSRQGSEKTDREREREGCQMKMLDMQKLKVKGKHFVYPPPPYTNTYTQTRRLSQKVPDKMQSAAVSGEETEREKL